VLLCMLHWWWSANLAMQLFCVLLHTSSFCPLIPLAVRPSAHSKRSSTYLHTCPLVCGMLCSLKKYCTNTNSASWTLLHKHGKDKQAICFMLCPI
jgi:hypothetical protein